MPVYDDERTEESLADDGLEESFYAPSATDDELSEDHPSRSDALKKQEEGAGETPGEAKDEPAKSEEESLEDQLGGFYKKAKNADKEAGENKFTLRGASKNARRNRLVGGGIIGFVTLLVGFFAAFGNFFALFKLDHLMENINAKSFSRFNASFSNRSDKYLQAYLKMRLTELQDKNGNYANDTLLFKADKVDTNSPIRDWYRTLRTSSFEADLEQKTGIVFSGASIKNDDGSITLRPVKVTIDNTTVATLDPEKSGLSKTTIDSLKAGRVDNSVLQDLNKLGDAANGIIKDTEIFDSNKAARKALRQDIKDNTHFWNVLKRRHIRKDIQNKTGISNWSFFEKTRDKIVTKKVALQKKILQKVLPDNKMGNFMQCILGSGPCGSGNDPAAPDNQQGALPDSTADPNSKEAAADTNSPTESFDENGNPVQLTDSAGNVSPDVSIDGSSTANEIAQTAEKAAKGEITDEAAKIAEKEGLDLVEKEALDATTSSYNPTKIWSWMKKITSIHNNLVNGKLSKLVKNFRLVQLAAIYSTYAIALDQAKTGQLTSEEFGDMMSTLSDASQNEGWIAMNNPGSETTVSAESTDQSTNLDKNSYCKESKKDQANNKVHYFCNSPGDSNAARIEDAYKNSFIYSLVTPIADVVNTIKHNPITNFFAGIADKFSSMADSIASQLFKILKPTLDALGITSNITKLVTLVMTKIMAFLGASPMFDGSGPGGLNMIMAGGASTAETSTRDSGGVVSTPATSAYTKQLAMEYEKDRKDSESLFDKYASLNNSSSVFSAALFSFSSSSLSGSLSSLFSSLGSLPSKFGSVITGRGFAATTNDFDIARWAGVDTYDVPRACQDLDPLDPDYTIRAVGVVSDSPYATSAQDVLNKVGALTIDQERDSANFWKTVYSNIDNKEKQEEISGAIYNCALFDQRVMGSMGYTSGYTNDGGLSSSEGSPSSNTTPSTGIPDDLCSGYYKLPNANGKTVQLDSNGWPVNASLVTYTGVKLQACTDRKAECQSGNMPYSQKGLCEAFKFYKTFYGANYTSSQGLDDNAKTLEWYGMAAKGLAEHRPAEWAANWRAGLNPYNFLACTGVTTMSIYYAYDPTYTSQVSRGNRFKKITSIYEVKPGDYINNYIPGVIGHSVIAASKYEDGKLVVFNATGFGQTAQFSVLTSGDITGAKHWDKAEFLRWNRDTSQ